MKILFLSVFTSEIAAYLYLGWITFFSKYDLRMPVPYIVLHIVAAIHLVCLLVLLGTFFVQGSASLLRTVAILASLPSIVGVIVLFTIKMIHRWF